MSAPFNSEVNEIMGRPRGSRNRDGGGQGVYLYVPATFDAGRIEGLRGCEDYAHWLVHKVLTSPQRYRHERTFDGFVRVSRETMGHYIPDPSTRERVRNTLLADRILVLDPSYLASSPERVGFAQSYAIHGDQVGDLRRVEVRSKVLAARIRANRITVGNRPLKTEEMDATLAYLYRHLRSLRIDTERAYQIIEDQPSTPARVIEVKVGRKRRKRIVRIAIPSTRTINRMTVDNLCSDEPDFTVCPYGRLHTPVTRLISECRSALSISS